MISGNEMSLTAFIFSKKLSKADFGFVSLITFCHDVDLSKLQKDGIVLELIFIEYREVVRNTVYQNTWFISITNFITPNMIN